MDGCGDATSGLTLGNGMDEKDGTNDVPHIKNEDVDVVVWDNTNVETNCIGRVIETLPWVPGDKGMCCNIIDDPLLLDIVTR